jgi:hypothetical protein
VTKNVNNGRGDGWSHSKDENFQPGSNTKLFDRLVQISSPQSVQAIDQVPFEFIGIIPVMQHANVPIGKQFKGFCVIQERIVILVCHV